MSRWSPDNDYGKDPEVARRRLGMLVVGGLGLVVVLGLYRNQVHPPQGPEDFEKLKLRHIRALELGEFRVESGEVAICDPGYGDHLIREGQIATKIGDVLNGTWNARLVRYTFISPRATDNAELWAYHESYTPPESPEWEDLHPDIGVDSGQAGIFDYRHFGKDESIPEDYVWNREKLLVPADRWYSYNCDLTGWSRHRAGVLRYGAVSSSGWGDGGYPAHAIKNAEGKYVALRLVFIPREYCELVEPEADPPGDDPKPEEGQ